MGPMKLRAAPLAPALKKGAGLVGEYLYALARLDRRSDDAERRAESCGSERARVAVCQDRGIIRYQLGAELAHPTVALYVFAVNRARLLDEQEFYTVYGSTFAPGVFKSPSHALDAPEEVRRRGARVAYALADALEIELEILNGFGRRVFRADRHTHGRRYAERRSAAHHHIFDGAGDLFICFEDGIDFLGRQPPLIDHYDAFVCPFYSLYHPIMHNIEQTSGLATNAG